MKRYSAESTQKLLTLMDVSGYKMVQENGQRKFGPPPDWIGPPPPRGCEVFVGKIPRDCYEDELVPLFQTVGKIYEMRLMMDFSGTNRGFGFVTFSQPSETYKAIRLLNNYPIRPKSYLGVVKSVDNSKLFIGGVPRTRKAYEIHQELAKKVSGIKEVTVFPHPINKEMNRGFAFVEFESHRSAAMARRSLIPGCMKLWDDEIVVDWAEPEPDIDDQVMKQVKVLYMRNIPMSMDEIGLKAFVEKTTECKLTRCKKLKNFAFVHFKTRAEAEKAHDILAQNLCIDGNEMEVQWAKPVVKDVYKLQKLRRGNGKFNNSSDLGLSLSMYKKQILQDCGRERHYKKRHDSGVTNSTENSSSGFVGECSSEDLSVCTTPFPLQEASATPHPYSYSDLYANSYGWGPSLLYPPMSYLTPSSPPLQLLAPPTAVSPSHLRDYKFIAAGTKNFYNQHADPALMTPPPLQHPMLPSYYTAQLY